MEALSSSVIPSRFLERSPALPSPLQSSIKAHFRRPGNFKVAEYANIHFFWCFRERAERVSIGSGSRRARAAAREISNGGDDEGTSGNGFGLIPEETSWFEDGFLSAAHQMDGVEHTLASWWAKIAHATRFVLLRNYKKFSSNSSLEESEQRSEDQNSIGTIPLTGSGTSGGSRAGLFRTPISGGVQSATSAHDLPRPALAVRNLMEQARYAHLCTLMSRMHHRREGYPFGSLVDFAPDSMGHPIFSFSPLAIHTRNLLADPRCTLVVQIPGWSGLSNARVTIFGDVFPLPADEQEWAHKQYTAKHQQGASQQWGNFYYFRMQNVSDIYFIGGFGTVAWVDVKEYETLLPDKIAVDDGEQNLKELNALFSKPLKELLSTETEIDDAAFISIDSKGTDIRVRQGAQFNIQRLSFEAGHGVQTLEEAKAALRMLISKGSRPRLHNKA